jgi:hypothetical protein
MSITSANAVLMFAITGLYDSPQRLQGFAADDIYTVDNIPSAEAIMGVDGILSAGFVYAPIPQTIALQADSISNSLFEHWVQAQKFAREAYLAQATIVLLGIARKYSMVNGALTSHPAMPTAARTLQPRRYTITWESVEPANV